MNNFTVDTASHDKRQLFIDATIHSLAQHGYKATTVRQIAKIAGVTPGLLTHYFSGKQVLIAESYRFLAKKFLTIFEARIEGQKDQPLAALKTFITATFDADNLDPKLLKVWLSFWSLTLSEPALAHIHKDSHAHYVGAVERLLGQAYIEAGRTVPAAKLHGQAVGINALLDGMWLEWCLNPATFSSTDGLDIVFDFVEAATDLKVRS